MTQGLDKTSVSMSDRVNQLNLSQSKDEGNVEEELLIEQINGKEREKDLKSKNDASSAEQANAAL